MKWSASLVLVCSLLGRAALADVIYVDSRAQGANTGASWQDAYFDLHDALDAAGSGSEIWVAGGPYVPNRDSGGIPAGADDTFAVPDSGLRIYGGFLGGETHLNQRNPFLNKTILTGLAEKFHVLTIENEFDNGVHVDGFLITGGAAIDDQKGTDFNGGGALIYASDSTFANCAFVANHASIAGGGLYANVNQLNLVNCIFFDNSAGIDAANGTGGGLYVRGQLAMANCLFHRNFAGFNGAGHAAYIESINTEFPALIYTSTFTNNGDVIPAGDGTIAAYGPLFVANSIIWGNRAGKNPSISDDPNEPALLYFSDIEGRADSGNSVIDVNPSFAAATWRNFRLLRGSACEDAGHPEFLPNDFADIDHDGDYDETLPRDLELTPRIQRNLNLGCFEDYDCQGNDVGDGLEIADDRVRDCNDNEIPDECDIRDCEVGDCADCNGNGVPDGCELAGPDAGQLDCDDNGQLDSCEIAADPDKDCNKNGLLDLCDGSLVDCNGDGIPDTCSQQNTNDVDADGVPDCIDNCPTKPNADQRDGNGNGSGDACDSLLKLDPCPGPITLTAPNAAGARVEFALPAARDGFGEVIVAATPPSGSVFSIGTTEVVVLAVDQADARVSCSFNVVVLPPIDDSTRPPADEEQDCPPLYRMNSGALRVLGIPVGCGPGCLMAVPLVAAGLAGAKLRRRR